MVESIAPEILNTFFPHNYQQIHKYHDYLLHHGIPQGLIGPREADKLWDRHILNSALISSLIPPHSSVVDIGSGAGLPGIPLYLANDTLRVSLVEPMQRRVKFLNDCLTALNLTDQESTITLFHGKAQSPDIIKKISSVDFVTARAVSSLTNLALWGRLFLRSGGELIALKGEKVHSELIEAKDVLKQQGFDVPTIEQLNIPNTDISAMVVRVKVK